MQEYTTFFGKNTYVDKNIRKFIILRHKTQNRSPVSHVSSYYNYY